MKYRKAQRRERSSNGKISKIGELTLEVTSQEWAAYQQMSVGRKVFQIERMAYNKEEKNSFT